MTPKSGCDRIRASRELQLSGLAWGIQRHSAVLTSSVKPARIRENFDVTALPASAIQDINERLETRYRFNSVVDAGEPGFAEVPKG